MYKNHAILVCLCKSFFHDLCFTGLILYMHALHRKCNAVVSYRASLLCQKAMELVTDANIKTYVFTNNILCKDTHTHKNFNNSMNANLY